MKEGGIKGRKEEVGVVNGGGGATKERGLCRNEGGGG